MKLSKLTAGVFAALMLWLGSEKATAEMVDTNFALGSCVIYTEGKPIPFGRWNNTAGAECKAFDGNLNTSTGSGKTWAEVGLMVDFGQAQTINEMAIQYTSPKVGNDPLDYLIKGSDNGVTWQLIRSVKNSALVDSQTALNANYRFIVVQLSKVGFDPWYGAPVDEISLWGKTEGVVTGIKLNKPRAYNAKSSTTGSIHFSTLTGRTLNANSARGTATGYYLPRQENNGLGKN